MQKRLARRSAAGVLTASVAALALVVPSGAAAQTILDEAFFDEGPLAIDQTPATARDVAVPAPAAPIPVSADGVVGSFTTELWSPQETGAERGLRVVNSTDADTAAVTGIVLNEDTRDAVAGATVQLYDPCPTCYGPESAGAAGTTAGAVVVQTTTDSNGAFAFKDVPPAPDLDLTVSASNYGLYTVKRTSYYRNEYYETTVELESQPQTYDDKASKSESTAFAAASGSGYDSHARVPPFITVAIRPTDQLCAPSGNASRARRYPWRYYVLHTLAGEIDQRWRREANRAVGAAIQNYAWYHRIRGGTAQLGADVDNTTRFQCFKRFKQIPGSWRDWVEDVLDERIVSNDQIHLTQYRAGVYTSGCSDPNYPQDGNILSQEGARKRDNDCGVDDWRNLDEYYYTGGVTNGGIPPRPQTSFSRSGGLITFNFPSRVSSSHVGWRYQVERFQPTGDQAGWHVICDTEWSWRQRTVPTSCSYRPGAGHDYRYRARANNPVDWSAYASFNNDMPIAP
ncbi:MAG: carboxypeptidase-like regulatory domain-containing protein [Actinomycetota bacterium]|nr:carboxypeptidase-like regulatory domain-containing protein [Actinomycetota bacterium]